MTTGMAALKLLAIAAVSRHVAYVYLIGDRLVDWRISDRASSSAEKASATVQGWINLLGPEVVVTEKVSSAVRKGRKAKAAIDAIAMVAANNEVLDVSVNREQAFANKYLEADAIVADYPELRPWLPKKRLFYDNEPRNTVLFEAMALAQVVLQGPASIVAR
jgi:archaeosine-15-forming tRNA-guanine transglycosylase